MCCAGPRAAMLGGLYPASVAVAAGASVGASLSGRPVPIATDSVLPIDGIPVAVVAVVAIVSVAVVAVGYPVVYQGSVLVLAELADQLGFQS